jgi:hypothetical protein
MGCWGSYNSRLTDSERRRLSGLPTVGTPFLIIFFLLRQGRLPPWDLFLMRSHISWPRSGDCEGSRNRTRDCCLFSLVSPSCKLSHHIPNWATTSLYFIYFACTRTNVPPALSCQYNIIFYSHALTFCHIEVPAIDLSTTISLHSYRD